MKKVSEKPIEKWLKRRRKNKSAAIQWYWSQWQRRGYILKQNKRGAWQVQFVYKKEEGDRNGRKETHMFAFNQQAATATKL